MQANIQDFFLCKFCKMCFAQAKKYRSQYRKKHDKFELFQAFLS